LLERICFQEEWSLIIYQFVAFQESSFGGVINFSYIQLLIGDKRDEPWRQAMGSELIHFSRMIWVVFSIFCCQCRYITL